MKYFTKIELEDITNSLLENPSYETLKELNNKYNGVENVITEEVSMPSPEINNIIPVEEAPVVENAEMQNIEAMPNLETIEEPTAMPNVEMPQAPINTPNIEVSPEVQTPVEPVAPSFGLETEPTTIPNMGMPPETQPAVTENISVPSFEVPIEQAAQTVPNNFPNVTEPVQETNTIPSFDIPNSTGNIEITGPNIEANNQTVPSFQNIDLNNLQKSQNNNPAQNGGVVPFDGNLWTPNTPDASSMMQPTENFNQNTPMSNETPQYQQGPSMFGQLQNTYQ